MARDWINEDKHKAKDAFQNAHAKKTEPQREPEKQKPPQPQLTPNGPMRSIVDQKVREGMDARRARIAERKREIQQKFEQDRAKSRAIER